MINCKNLCKFSFGFLLILSGFTSKIFACTCIGTFSICEAFAQSDAVIVGSVIQFESALKPIKENNFLRGQKVIIKVEKAFKGINKDEVTLWESGSNCDWQFDEKDRGKQFLFYLKLDKSINEYKIVECGRSAEVGSASNDLTWLNGLPKSLERTRFSGVLEHYDDILKQGQKIPFFSFIDYIVGTKIKIYSKRKSYEVLTDKNGMFEIWDLPTGKYKVKPKFPQNFSVYLTMPQGEVEYRKLKNNQEDLDDFTIEVKPKGCAGINYVLKKTN